MKVESCEETVKVPVLPMDSASKNSSLRGWDKGFKLTWYANYDCSTCECSGGHCAFSYLRDWTNICFYPDGGRKYTPRYEFPRPEDTNKCHPYFFEENPDPRNTIPGCPGCVCNASRVFQYPFWFDGTGSTYCGYPGLGVSCDYGGVLSISDDKYYIKHIDYERRIITLADVNMISNNACVSPVHIVKLQTPSSLSYGDETSFCTLYFNCISFHH
ncbi:hypothetical protein GH714_026277 [Hevea brasiliensis]|uniref:non-specific serine/threonine protein kinase n=1 Tax=Hevea brasiliensis TaxID=3981 RepID=A0A6A6M0V4_HEVBR|nr:hypothetical protein GH714_026277 [Hevea brasiliensis]